MQKTWSVLVLALVVPLLGTAGCQIPTVHIRCPVVTMDSSGNAMVVYETNRGAEKANFYARKLTPEGDNLWGKKDVLIGSGHPFMLRGCQAPPPDLQIVADGFGGAIVIWSTLSEPDEEFAKYMTKVDQRGEVVWDRELSERGDLRMVSDGLGGVILAWSEGSKLYTQRVSPKGEDGKVQMLGRTLCGHCFDITRNQLGGAFLVWETRGEQKERDYLFVQQIDSKGNALWGQKGLVVYSSPKSEEASREIDIGHAMVASDSSGGTFVFWLTSPLGKVVDWEVKRTGKPAIWKIIVQRIDAGGNIVWQKEGKPIFAKKRIILPREAISDDSGGAIVFWRDDSSLPTPIYAQRINAEGEVLWPKRGVEVLQEKEEVGSSPAFFAVNDGSGGALVILRSLWHTEGPGAWAQRIDAEGKLRWQEGGVPIPISIGDPQPTISPSGDGGAFLGLNIGNSLYVQRLNAEGKRIWDQRGIRLTP